MSTVLQAAKIEAASVLRQLDQNAYRYHNEERSIEGVFPQAMALSAMEGTDAGTACSVGIASLFLDTGFIDCYAGNELIGAERAMRWMVDSGFDFSLNDKTQVYDAILGASGKEEPKSIVESIVRDADLSVLGLSRYIMVNLSLRKESLIFPDSPLHIAAQDHTKWTAQQIVFVGAHRWLTESAGVLYEPGRQRNMRTLEKYGTLPTQADLCM